MNNTFVHTASSPSRPLLCLLHSRLLLDAPPLHFSLVLALPKAVGRPSQPFFLPLSAVGAARPPSHTSSSPVALPVDVTPHTSPSAVALPPLLRFQLLWNARTTPFRLLCCALACVAPQRLRDVLLAQLDWLATLFGSLNAILKARAAGNGVGRSKDPGYRIQGRQHKDPGSRIQTGSTRRERGIRGRGRQHLLTCTASCVRGGEWSQ
eukprot:358726-Chlamydomonas_euryale.AAC.9